MPKFIFNEERKVKLFELIQEHRKIEDATTFNGLQPFLGLLGRLLKQTYNTNKQPSDDLIIKVINRCQTEYNQINFLLNKGFGWDEHECMITGTGEQWMDLKKNHNHLYEIHGEKTFRFKLMDQFRDMQAEDFTAEDLGFEKLSLGDNRSGDYAVQLLIKSMAEMAVSDAAPLPADALTGSEMAVSDAAPPPTDADAPAASELDLMPPIVTFDTEVSDAARRLYDLAYTVNRNEEARDANETTVIKALDMVIREFNFAAKDVLVLAGLFLKNPPHHLVMEKLKVAERETRDERYEWVLEQLRKEQTRIEDMRG